MKSSKNRGVVHKKRGKVRMFSLKDSLPFSKKKASLTTQFSILLVLAATLPLLITVLGNYFILRPTLLSQAAVEMGNGANINARVINSYLSARSQEVAFLGQSTVIQQYLAGGQDLEHQALNQLVAGDQLDTNYTAWTLFDAQGNLLLTYPTYPKPRGKSLVPASALQQLHNGKKLFFSDVYFDTVTNIPFIDIYTSVTGTGTGLVGIGRATLNLVQIWAIVNNEANINTGGYAMIIDGHGVCIAYTITNTLPPALFKAIAPLTKAFSQQLKDENLYGNNQTPVTVLSDAPLANMLNNPQGPAVFETTPRLQNQSFQVARAATQIIPWTYLVFKPVGVITAAANQQELYLFLLAIVVTVLAALSGLVVSRGITRPILRSVSTLQGNSHSLKNLADMEQMMSKEQEWIIECAQVGLNAVQHYADAAAMAAQHLNQVGNEFLGKWEKMDPQQAKKYLNEIVTSAQYISKATIHQKKNFNGLASGIKVSTQVTEQLSTNSTKTFESATVMEEVVEQLREVVGGSINDQVEEELRKEREMATVRKD
jgi:methyl-accepting chemotaxis protein